MPSLLDAFENPGRWARERSGWVGWDVQIATVLAMQLLEALLAVGAILDVRCNGLDFVRVEEVCEKTLELGSRRA